MFLRSNKLNWAAELHTCLFKFIHDSVNANCNVPFQVCCFWAHISFFTYTAFGSTFRSYEIWFHLQSELFSFFSDYTGVKLSLGGLHYIRECWVTENMFPQKRLSSAAHLLLALHLKCCVINTRVSACLNMFSKLKTVLLFLKSIVNLPLSWPFGNIISQKWKKSS